MTPADLAHQVITQVMLRGSAKEGSDDSWRSKPDGYHLHKALRHAITFKMIRDGHQTGDDEKHLWLAITRMAMALAQAETT